MNKLLIGVVILLIVGVGAFLILSNSDSSNDDSEDLDTNDNGGIIGDSGDDEVKVFVVDGKNFRFYVNGVENPDIKVNEGDKVRIEFTSSEGFHDFTIDEFDAKTERVNASGSSSVEFIADKKGAFEYYCSVDQHRANGMKGRFIVE